MNVQNLYIKDGEYTKTIYSMVNTFLYIHNLFNLSYNYFIIFFLD